MEPANLQSIEKTIKNEALPHDPGWCFTPRDLIGLGSDAAIRQALCRLEAKGVIRRLAQGLYEFPRTHPRLGLLPPSVDQVAQAIARRDNIKVQPAGAYAANLLGLSEQVPSRIVFVTDGAAKKIKIGRTEIVFKKTTAKTMATAGTALGLVIQALKHIGQERVTQSVQDQLRKHLRSIDPEPFKKGVQYAPAWIRKLMIQLKEGQHGSPPSTIAG